MRWSPSRVRDVSVYFRANQISQSLPPPLSSLSIFLLLFVWLRNSRMLMEFYFSSPSLVNLCVCGAMRRVLPFLLTGFPILSSKGGG